LLNAIKITLFLLVFIGIVWVGLRAVLNRGDITQKPPKQYEPLTLIEQNSSIAISADINLTKLQEKLNENYSKPFTIPKTEKKECLKKKILGTELKVGCTYWGEVQKKEPLTLEGKEDKLSISLPLHTKIKAKTNKFNIKTSTQMDVTLKSKLKPILHPDWKFSIESDSNFTWDKKPKINIFNLFSVQVDKMLGKRIQASLKKADEKAVKHFEKFHIKDKVSTIWNNLYEPIKLSNFPDIWIQTVPQAVHFSGIKIDNNKLSTAVSFKTKLFTTIGSKTKTIEPQPLPNLDNNISHNEDFNIYLPIYITYETIIKQIEKALKIGQKHKLLEKELENKLENNFQNTATFITVKKVFFYPSNGHMVLGIKFIADLPNYLLDTRGTVYFIAKPVVDNQEHKLILENLHYTRISDNRIFDAFSELLYEPILQRLNQHRVYDFSKEYTKLINRADSKLNRPLKNGFFTQGKVEKIDLKELHLDQEGLYITVSLRGKLKILFDL
jgi:hypothetical protein